MNQGSLSKYLEDIGLMHNPSITQLGFGDANINYLAESGREKIVVRMVRDDVPTESRLAHERHFMQFVEAMGIQFTSKSLYFDVERQIHVTSYVDGADASIIDLNEQQMEIFVRQLKHLEAIPYGKYTEWCISQGIKPVEPQPGDFRVKVNIDDRFEYIRQCIGNPFADEVVKWAQPKLERFYTEAREVPKRNIFLHGDLRWNKGGGNMRISGNDVTFIDWEMSRFIHDGMGDVADVLGSIPLENKDVFQKLYEMYMLHESNKLELDTSIEYGVLWGKLGNPLWAAERYLIMSDKNQSGTERYRDLALQGMKDADFFYGREFSKWFC